MGIFQSKQHCCSDKPIILPYSAYRHINYTLTYFSLVLRKRWFSGSLDSMPAPWWALREILYVLTAPCPENTWKPKHMNTEPHRSDLHTEVVSKVNPTQVSVCV